MDNFILYDDICKTENSTVYKGRRKGSINFVAIHCIDKILRPEITNLVRLTFEMSHQNTVKFYEWYETSNHLWLVVELCTAGSLETLLEQDGCLPEASIKQFGIDICEGLFYCHSIGLLFCDLIPRKIMIDGYGNLKLSDFGLSKLDGEDLEEIFKETFDSTSAQWSESTSTAKPPKLYKKPFGDVGYMAPELILGEDNTKESDLWSFGCLLYKMYTGNLPFVSENEEQLKNFIVNKDLPNPKGNKLSTKPSVEFISLLRGLLEKNHNKRLNWKQVVNHPFWENKLEHLIPVIMSRKSLFIDGKDDTQEEEDELDEVDDQVNHLNASRLLTDRPKTAGGSMVLEKHPEINVSFSISSRLPTSPQSTIQTRTAVQCNQESDLKSSSTDTLKIESDDNPKFASRNESLRLFFMPSELNVSQIIDNPKIHKSSLLKFEPKALPFSNAKLLKTSTFLQLSKPDFEKALEQIKANTNVPTDKSASAIKLKLHLMNYIGTLCTEATKFADSFIQVELYRDLLNIVKIGHNLEMKSKAARVMAIIFNRAKKLDTSKDLSDTLQGLIDQISNNRKDVKFKQALLPALGELLYFISCQECILAKSQDSWPVPSLAYVLMIRTIGDDLVSNHIICKIIENIASTNSHCVQKFINNQSEVVNAIWSCYSHSANNEQLRVAALKALCMLSSHSVNIVLTLIDKIGVDPLLECLSSNNGLQQQAMLTMISILVKDGPSKSIPEKKLVCKLVNIYESANVSSRAKAYLLTYVMLKNQSDLVNLFTQSKLINSLERDHRKSFPNREENDYMHRTIELLLDLLATIATKILDETVIVLESVYGRKNPSTAQSKQLKKCIPMVSVIRALVTSGTYRAKVVDAVFIEKFGTIIELSKPVNSNELNLDTICGQGVLSEYINSVTSISETIIQHRTLLQSFSLTIMEFILPSLIENITSNSSEIKISCIKFLSEVCALYFNTQEQAVSEEIKRQLKTFIEHFFIDIVEGLLSQSEPLPYFSLNIIHSVLVYDITVISVLKVRNILPGFFKLFQIYKNKIGSPVVLKLLNIVRIWSSTLDPSDLYEQSVVDVLKSMLLEISKMKKYDETVINQILIELLKISDNLLKYVSEFVKKALQAKKAPGSSDSSIAQKAERLLHSNKTLSGCSQFLLNLLLNEDADINEMSCKILWMLMQLFGSECKDLLNPDNMNIILAAIMHSNSKKQKILLRISKRLITADKHNLELFKTIGCSFIESLSHLKNQANSEANVSLSSMIDEILKLV